MALQVPLLPSNQLEVHPEPLFASAPAHEFCHRALPPAEVQPRAGGDVDFIAVEYEVEDALWGAVVDDSPVVPVVGRGQQFCIKGHDFVVVHRV